MSIEDKEFLVLVLACWIIFVGLLFYVHIQNIKEKKELNNLIESKYNVVVDEFILCEEKNNISVYSIKAKEKIKIQNTIFTSNKPTVYLCLAVVNGTKIIELKNKICLKLCPEWWLK